MLRVKDAQKSLNFYRHLLGMRLVQENHFGPGSGDFSLYFLADAINMPEGVDISDSFAPVIELTHNHGTENDPDFKYHNGNDQDNGAVRGFGHTVSYPRPMSMVHVWPLPFIPMHPLPPTHCFLNNPDPLLPCSLSLWTKKQHKTTQHKKHKTTGIPCR